jgi:hypothetical protein
LTPAYSADGIYLFSTLDGPDDNPAQDSPTIVPNNNNHETASMTPLTEASQNPWADNASTSLSDREASAHRDDHAPEDTRMGEDSEDSEDSGSDEETDEDEDEDEPLVALEDPGITDNMDTLPTSILRPRRRYAGARNIDTIKDGPLYILGSPKY